MGNANFSNFRSSEVVQKAVSRILDIFEERQIYSKSQLADMRAAQSEIVLFFLSLFFQFCSN